MLDTVESINQNEIGGYQRQIVGDDDSGKKAALCCASLSTNEEGSEDQGKLA